MSGSLVSVVVPSYAHEQHLEEALRSVAAQTHPALELIVVDDASPDRSVEVARRILGEHSFAARFEGRVQLHVHESNRGAHEAINAGLRAASGSHLAILNSDDAYAPSRLSALLEAVRATGASLAFGRVEYVGDRGEAGWERERFRLRRHQDGIARHPSVGFACLCSNVAITTGNLFFTRSLWESVGDFDALRYCHDWDYLLRAVVLSEPIYVPEAVYLYRLHGTNSYKSLSDVAEQETRIVLSRFFQSVRRGSVRNPLAPSPAGWPGVFDHVMSAHGFWAHW